MDIVGPSFSSAHGASAMEKGELEQFLQAHFLFSACQIQTLIWVGRSSMALAWLWNLEQEACFSEPESYL